MYWIYHIWKVSSYCLSYNVSTRWSINKDSFYCNQINNLRTQEKNYIITYSVLYITTQAFFIGLCPLVSIIQWYYALQHRIAASCSTAHSTLVLWKLPVALNLVDWILKTVVQLLVATKYNCAHANTFPRRGTILILTTLPLRLRYWNLKHKQT